MEPLPLESRSLRHPEAANSFDLSQKLIDEQAVQMDALKKDVSGWKATLQNDQIIFDRLKTEIRNVVDTKFVDAKTELAKFVGAKSFEVNGSSSLAPLVPPLVMPPRTISDCIDQLTECSVSTAESDTCGEDASDDAGSTTSPDESDHECQEAMEPIRKNYNFVLAELSAVIDELKDQKGSKLKELKEQNAQLKEQKGSKAAPEARIGEIW